MTAGSGSGATTTSSATRMGVAGGSAEPSAGAYIPTAMPVERSQAIRTTSRLPEFDKAGHSSQARDASVRGASSLNVTLEWP